MAPALIPHQSSAGDAGIFAHLRAFFASFAQYLRARLQLAGIESKEAFVHYLLLLMWVVIALAVVVFGYVFLCIGLVVLIAGLLHVNWPWVMVAFAVAHFVFAIICLFLAKGRLAKPMFTATLGELRKDAEWLGSKP